MSPQDPRDLAPTDRHALIAVDLGAESCRVSLLRWNGATPEISLVHRFSNAPRDIDAHLRWDLARIERGLDEGIRKCATDAPEGIRSIAVDGWAVDYVRLDIDGKPLGDPFCYRDERTLEAEASLHRRCRPERLRELTGVQLLRINTAYQLHADVLMELPQGGGWINLPEYILARWGGRRVAERTNASHTGLIDLSTGEWCPEIFDAAQVEVARAAVIVPPGTRVGWLTGELAALRGLRDVALIAPACHDTASAIAGVAAAGQDWAYISSGTWSLVGTLLDDPRNGPQAAAENFTNLAAVGGRVCFHKNVNGMWLLRQCIDAWAAAGRIWTVPELIVAAETVPCPRGALDVDDDDLLLSGEMLQRINTQRSRKGYAVLNEAPDAAPFFASLIFHSLAARYAEVLKRIEFHSGKRFKRLFIVGGASQNVFLNRLTAEATGLEVFRGAAESSTIGNFATQLAVLEGDRDDVIGVDAERVSSWSGLLLNSFEPTRHGSLT